MWIFYVLSTFQILVIMALNLSLFLRSPILPLPSTSYVSVRYSRPPFHVICPKSYIFNWILNSSKYSLFFKLFERIFILPPIRNSLSILLNLFVHSQILIFCKLFARYLNNFSIFTFSNIMKK